MASLVVGVAGAAVGMMVGVPPTVGFLLGSALGGILFPPKGPDGPRLNDLSVQTSTYGRMIPIPYGTDRIAGNVIWAQRIQEHASEHGGKGGPTTTTYSYSCTFAASICAGPISGVSRIWADGLLIYDCRPTNTGATVGFSADSYKIYLGTEDQLPDPTIQAIQGDTPAYRGQAYIVFNNLQLEKFGNRVPSLTFEYITEALPLTSRQAVPMGPGTDIAIEPITKYVWAPYQKAASDGSRRLTVDVYDPVSLAVVRTIDVAAGGTDIVNICAAEGFMWVAQSGDNFTAPVLSKIDPVTYQVLTQGSTTYEGVVSDLGHVTTDGVSLTLSTTNGAGSNTSRFIDAYSSGSPPRWPKLTVSTPRTGLVFGSVVNHTSNTICFAGSGAWLDIQAAAPAADGGIASFTVSLHGRGWPGAGPSPRLLEVVGTSLVIWGSVGRNSIALVDTVSGAITRLLILATGRAMHAMYYSPDTNILYVDSGQVVTAYNVTTGEQLDEYPNSGYAQGQQLGTSIYLGNETFIACESSSSPVSRVWKIQFSTAVAGQPVRLKDIVSDVSARCGLLDADLDVSELTDLVEGYTLTSQMPGRSAIEPLMQAYFFDPVESDYQIKFRKRNRQAVVTIPDDDLAAHSPGSDAPDLVQMKRAQETDLPQSVSVRYKDIDADYQTSAQYERRMTGRSQSDLTVDIPVAMRAAKASQIAAAALYSAWSERTGLTFSTSLKYAAYEPTDVAIVRNRRVRLVHRKRNGGVLEWEAYADGNTIYSSESTNAAGASAAPGLVGQVIPTIPAVQLVIMDAPIARAGTAAAVLTFAAQGTTAGFSGAQVFKSADNGVSYQPLVSIPSASLIGYALTALGDWAGGDMFDEINSVTVRLLPGATNDTLSSTTALAVLNGANAALLGNEVLQYKLAILNADGTYTLSGLLRYRRGTDYATHTPGETFVPITSSLVQIPVDISEIGNSRLYKAVANGGTLASAQAVTLTYSGNDLKPYAPVQIGGGRDVSGGLLLNWIRRSRTDGSWRDSVDVPIGESVEAYDVEIINGAGAVVRTFSALSSPSVTYTSAQQIADFGALQSSVNVRVYQLSSVVGRGRPGAATV